MTTKWSKMSSAHGESSPPSLFKTAGGAIEHEMNTQSNVRVFIPYNQRDDYPQVPSSDEEEEELEGDGK
jgi:hypothetical protein